MRSRHARGYSRVSRIKESVILIVTGRGVILADDINGVRPVGQTGEADSGEGCEWRTIVKGDFGAERAVVQLPFESSPTPLLRGIGAPIERATRTHRKNGAGARVCSAWVSRDGDAVRLKTTEIQSAKSSADGRRTGPKLRRLPYLGNSHVRWRCAIQHSQVQHWINHLIAVTCSAPGH